MKKIVRLFARIITIIIVVGCSGGESTDKQQDRARTLLSNGEFALNHDSIPTAIEYLTSAKEIGQQIENKEIAFEADVYMALLYDMIGMPDSAYNLLKQLSYLETKNRKTLGSLYYIRLMAYYSADIDKDYDRALQYNDSAIALDNRIYSDVPSLRLIDMANRSELLIMANRGSEAKPIIDSLEQVKVEGSQLHLSQAYYSHALLCESNGDIDSAYEYLGQSMELARQFDGVNNTVTSLRHMLKIDSLRHDADAYISNMNKLNSIEASLSGSQAGYQVAVIQQQYSNALVHKDNERKQMLMVSITAIILVIVFSIMIFIWRNSKAKQILAQQEQERLKAVSETEKLNNELLQLRMAQKTEQLQQANRDNLAMSVQLASIIDKDEKDRLQPLESQLRQQDREMYEVLFRRYPKLTRNDMRLISYIRMGMDSNEIIQIQNITLDSLHKYRYRLRKKFGLTPDQGLDEFIASII